MAFLGPIVVRPTSGSGAGRAIFRAVSEAELRDIVDSGQLRADPAASGRCFEGKLFAETLSDASGFGADGYHLHLQPVFVLLLVLTDIGFSLLQPGWADGRRWLAADRDDLPSLNTEVRLVVALGVNACPR